MADSLRMGSRRSFTALVCVAMTLVAACAINPVSGHPQFVLVSKHGEKEMGEHEAQRVEQRMGFVDDVALTAYVDAIGQRLAAHSPRRDVQYQFHVVDMPEPNAFALPGGYVYLSRGLLVLVNSEDELAGVVAHEIGHVAARHSVAQITRAAPLAVMTNLSAAVTGLASPLLGQVVGGVGGLASGLVLAPFSRDQEREADRVGQEMVAAAGWDPAGLAKILGTMEREQELEGNEPGRTTFLASHPSTPERVANTTAYAKELKRTPSAPICETSAALLARLDGLVVGQGAEEGVFVGQAFLHPDLDLFIRFPADWRTHNDRHQAGAESPDDSALVLLQTVGEGEDPLAAARALERTSGSPVVQNTRLGTVGGLKIAWTRARTHTASGDVIIELAWIAYAGQIYQVVGLAPLQRSDWFAPLFDGVVQSFRPLEPAERASIRENHLRVIQARQDEELGALIARSKGRWGTPMTAVVNALSADQRLAAGQLVKLAVAEPYAGGALNSTAGRDGAPGKSAAHH
jgi:predicted Zn-dependent protease